MQTRGRKGRKLAVLAAAVGSAAVLLAGGAQALPRENVGRTAENLIHKVENPMSVVSRPYNKTTKRVNKAGALVGVCFASMDAEDSCSG